MSRASLKHILRDIELLDEEELLAVDRHLAERLREEWEREASAAREQASRRGIDQAAIDQAIERRRYDP